MSDYEKTWGRIQKGDKNALEELFNALYQPLCNYMVQFTHRMPDAEDIVQGEFVKLWTKREDLQIKTSIKSYLYKSAYNSFLLKVRKDKKKDEFFENLRYEAMSYAMNEDNSDFLLRIEKVKKIVGQLPERCREILMLSKREGYKNREIAELLGISIKTVESQIRIAFKKIRESFEDRNMLLFLLLKPFKKMLRIDAN